MKRPVAFMFTAAVPCWQRPVFLHRCHHSTGSVGCGSKSPIMLMNLVRQDLTFGEHRSSGWEAAGTACTICF